MPTYCLSVQVLWEANAEMEVRMQGIYGGHFLWRKRGEEAWTSRGSFRVGCWSDTSKEDGRWLCREKLSLQFISEQAGQARRNPGAHCPLDQSCVKQDGHALYLCCAQLSWSIPRRVWPWQDCYGSPWVCGSQGYQLSTILTGDFLPEKDLSHAQPWWSHGVKSDPGTCWMASSIMELRAEVNMFHSYVLELPTVPYFHKAGAPIALESASCLAIPLTCIEKAKLYPGKAFIPKTETWSRSQKENWSSQSSRNHGKSPSAARWYMSMLKIHQSLAWWYHKSWNLVQLEWMIQNHKTVTQTTQYCSV